MGVSFGIAIGIGIGIGIGLCVCLLFLVVLFVLPNVGDDAARHATGSQAESHAKLMRLRLLLLAAEAALLEDLVLQQIVAGQLEVALQLATGLGRRQIDVHIARAIDVIITNSSLSSGNGVQLHLGRSSSGSGWATDLNATFGAAPVVGQKVLLIRRTRACRLLGGQQAMLSHRWLRLHIVGTERTLHTHLVAGSSHAAGRALGAALLHGLLIVLGNARDMSLLLVLFVKLQLLFAVLLGRQHQRLPIQLQRGHTLDSLVLQYAVVGQQPSLVCQTAERHRHIHVATNVLLQIGHVPEPIGLVDVLASITCQHLNLELAHLCTTSWSLSWS